mmetsp:Transcript_42761/g.134742  ORF Transcript_42761/g.134742 Transcript_42761/m.134742 type:complete len:83 (+) Transcript_42761:708-956(+)
MRYRLKEAPRFVRDVRIWRIGNFSINDKRLLLVCFKINQEQSVGEMSSMVANGFVLREMSQKEKHSVKLHLAVMILSWSSWL